MFKDLDIAHKASKLLKQQEALPKCVRWVNKEAIPKPVDGLKTQNQDLKETFDK